MAICIGCGLSENVGGIGSVNVDPEGGILCQGGAGNGTPTAGQGIRIKSTNGACNGLAIAGDGTVTVVPNGYFQAFGGIAGTNLTPGSASVNAQMLVDNTNGCFAKVYLFTVEFNLQSDDTGQFVGVGGYRTNGGAWSDIYNLVAQTPATSPFSFCPSPQTVAAGATTLWDVRFSLTSGVDIDSYAIRMAAWGDYSS